jgi:hypothetical protein
LYSPHLGVLAPVVVLYPLSTNRGAHSLILMR